MKRALLMCVTTVAVAAVMALAALPTPARGQGTAPKNEPTAMTDAEFDAAFKANSNWGRWGTDDQLGTINLITDAKRRQAAAVVKSGISVSVTHDFSTLKDADNPTPLEFTMAPNFRGDTLGVQYHGTFVTHIDALCHFPYKERLYNDRPLGVSSAKGCVPGIQNLKDGIVTRGVLIDVPRLRGVEYLEPRTAIFKEEVEAWEKKTGIRIGPGDAVLLRTGRWARRAKVGPDIVLGNAAGLDASMMTWIKQRDVAIMGGDVSVEIQVQPPIVGGLPYPLHAFLIAGLGMPILDSLDTEALAATAARLNRYEFMFVVAPLAVPGGTGSPVNPIAIF